MNVYFFGNTPMNMKSAAHVAKHFGDAVELKPGSTIPADNGPALALLEANEKTGETSFDWGDLVEAKVHMQWFFVFYTSNAKLRDAIGELYPANPRLKVFDKGLAAQWRDALRAGSLLVNQGGIEHAPKADA